MGNDRWPVVKECSTSNLVIMLQKLAKNVSYYNPETRKEILSEAADRLTTYRQAERGMTCNTE